MCRLAQVGPEESHTSYNMHEGHKFGGAGGRDKTWIHRSWYLITTRVDEMVGTLDKPR